VDIRDNPLGYFLNEPMPIRKLLRYGIRDLGLGSFRLRFRLGALKRMYYAYIIYHAAQLAARLRIPRISVIEFGVAGGNGLVWMERHAEEIEKLFPVKIEIYGFDSGVGLPSPEDYRDLPYHWKQGFFKMDVKTLQSRLKRANLVLGDVRDTAATFLDKFSPAPIGAVSHDLDFYSSTVNTFQIFNGPDKYLMPRIFNYFDDTLGHEIEQLCDYTGERLAIEEFNLSHADRKFAVPYYLRADDCLAEWRYKIWVFHYFGHHRYNDFVSGENVHLPLKR
jgi:hypothetical protein